MDASLDTLEYRSLDYCIGGMHQNALDCCNELNNCIGKMHLLNAQIEYKRIDHAS